MPCINLEKIPYLKDYSLHDKEIEYVNSSVGIQDKHPTTKYKFYYVQFSTENSFSNFGLDEYVPADIIDRIKNKEVFLMLDNALEYFHRSVNSIYENIIIRYRIPAEQIIFLSAVPNMLDYVKECSKYYNLPEIKVDWFSLFEQVGKDAYRSLEKNPVSLKNKKFKKKFLNLNRRWRIHRPLMFLLLKNKNLLNDGYISFGPADDGKNWNHALDQLTKMYANHKKIRKIIANNRDVIDMNPLYLDTHDLVTNRAIHEDSVNQFYNETYLSVINETTYHEDIVFFSEKTFKAIAMGHPFIVATASNSLPYLKELGYKTFHPMIDESYDNIKDHGDRMLAIVDEIERICNLEESKLIEWLDCVEPICKHNQAILNKKKILTKPMNYKQ